MFSRRRAHESDAGASGEPDSEAAFVTETDLRRAIHEGAEHRRPRSETFSVLCIVPQVFREPVSAAERAVATSTIARELRIEDRFCQLDDASYVAMLPDTDDEQAAVVVQRLKIALTLRMAPVSGRKWMVGIANYPHDARTEAALIELAQDSALSDLAA